MTTIQTYLVGGAVRDELLGLDVKDRDWVVIGATPEDMLAQGFTQVGRQFPVFLHPHSKEEYALARREKKTQQGHTGFICEFSPDISLEEDLQRRDLTINAMAKDFNGHLYDPYHGLTDLQQRRLRHVSQAFVEDPLRVLRVARFAARFAVLDFQVDPDTLTLMQHISQAGELQALPAERIWRELELALKSRDYRPFFATLAQCGALPILIPELVESLNDIHQQATVPQFELTEQTWAYLCHSMSPTSLTQLQQRLKVPNSYAHLAIQVNDFYHNHTLPMTAEAWVRWLTQVQAVKKPQPFLRLVDVLAYLTLSQPTSWLQLRDAVAKIHSSAWVKQGFTGAELGDAIRQARQDALEQFNSPFVDAQHSPIR